MIHLKPQNSLTLIGLSPFFLKLFSPVEKRILQTLPETRPQKRLPLLRSISEKKTFSLNIFYIFLRSQSCPHYHLEKDEWEHPKKSPSAQITGCSRDSQHPARGFWEL